MLIIRMGDPVYYKGKKTKTTAEIKQRPPWPWEVYIEGVNHPVLISDLKLSSDTKTIRVAGTTLFPDVFRRQ